MGASEWQPELSSCRRWRVSGFEDALHVDAASVAASTHGTETHLWAATVWNWEGDGLRLGEMGVYFIADVWHRCVVAKSRPVSFFFKKSR